MSYKILFSFVVLTILHLYIEGCLITNCPRGGKRSENYRIVDEKGCISCGPGHTGKCLGSRICCGPFGCLIGTLETLRCRQEMYMSDREGCEISGLHCRKNNGKCAADGICCTHDACFIDKECEIEEKLKHLPEAISGINMYSLMNKYQSQMDINEP